MWHAAVRARTRLVVSVLLGLAVLSACSAPPPPPDVTVLRWMQAFAAQDGNAVAGLTCRASQSDVQNTRLLTMALGVAPPNFGGGGGQFFGGGGGGQLTYDVSQLQYETTFADTHNARVLVTGMLRIASGMSSPLLRMNTPVRLVA